MQTYKEALHDDDIKDNAVVVEKVLIIKDLWDALDKTDVATFLATMILSVVILPKLNVMYVLCSHALKQLKRLQLESFFDKTKTYLRGMWTSGRPLLFLAGIS